MLSLGRRVGLGVRRLKKGTMANRLASCCELVRGGEGLSCLLAAFKVQTSFCLLEREEDEF